MLRFVHPERKELQMGFCFDHVNLGRGGLDNAMVSPWTLPQFKAIIAEWQGIRDEGGWHALYLENHDQVSGAVGVIPTADTADLDSLEVSQGSRMIHPDGGRLPPRCSR